MSPKPFIYAVDLCSEGVSRRGDYVPCEKTAVAIRRDPDDGSYYPVCAYHARGDMLPLVELMAKFRRHVLDNEPRSTEQATS